MIKIKAIPLKKIFKEFNLKQKTTDIRHLNIDYEYYLIVLFLSFP